MDPWQFLGPNSKMDHQDGPFFMVCAASLGSKNHVILNFRKSKKHPMDRRACFQNGLPSFLDCVSYHLWGGQKKISQLALFRVFWETKMGSGAHVRIRRSPPREGKCSLCMVLSVSVVLCHGVSNDVFNDVFLRCVCERDDVKPQNHCSVLLVKKSLQRSRKPADRCSTHLFGHQRLPVQVLGYTRVKSTRNSAGLARSGCSFHKGERSGEHSGRNSTLDASRSRTFANTGD